MIKVGLSAKMNYWSCPWSKRTALATHISCGTRIGKCILSINLILLSRNVSPFWQLNYVPFFGGGGGGGLVTGQKSPLFITWFIHGCVRGYHHLC